MQEQVINITVPTKGGWPGDFHCVPAATDRQRSYLASLIRDRDVEYAMTLVDLTVLTKDEASRLITEALAARPMSAVYEEQASEQWAEGAWLRHAERPDFEAQEDLRNDTFAEELAASRAAEEKAIKSLRDGRYATEFGGTVRFFHINTPTSGKWAGFTFVEEQASDDTYPVKGARRFAVLAALAADTGALAAYGKLLGKCGVCGRTLTDALSRELGIGPVCREK